MNFNSAHNLGLAGTIEGSTRIGGSRRLDIVFLKFVDHGTQVNIDGFDPEKFRAVNVRRNSRDSSGYSSSVVAVRRSVIKMVSIIQKSTNCVALRII